MDMSCPLSRGAWQQPSDFDPWADGGGDDCDPHRLQPSSFWARRPATTSNEECSGASTPPWPNWEEVAVATWPTSCATSNAAAIGIFRLNSALESGKSQLEPTITVGLT